VAYNNSVQQEGKSRDFSWCFRACGIQQSEKSGQWRANGTQLRNCSTVFETGVRAISLATVARGLKRAALHMAGY
jgi:hypothetical protein